MINKILKTESNWGALIARLTLGVVLFAHGAQKMLGWFGGYGFESTVEAFMTEMGLPWFVAFAVIIIEFYGSIFLILGLGSRLWSLAVAGLFMGIIFTTQLEYGFYMNWYGNQAGEGFEFSLLVIGIAVVVLINGGGKYAVDSRITKLLNKS
ncbi:MAG: DoxX family protein [Flavobacteriaceae bacterium]|nr:DoxX family protein [Flavobacteriaceae bacterium]